MQREKERNFISLRQLEWSDVALKLTYCARYVPHDISDWPFL